MAGLNTTKNKNNCISDLVDWQAKNDLLECLFFCLSKLLDFIFQVFFIFTLPFILIFLSQNEKKIDHLINMIQSLAFLVCTLQNNSNISSHSFQLCM